MFWCVVSLEIAIHLLLQFKTTFWGCRAVTVYQKHFHLENLKLLTHVINKVMWISVVTDVHGWVHVRVYEEIS